VNLIWLNRSIRLSTVPGIETDRLRKATKLYARIALVIFSAALAANALASTHPLVTKNPLPQALVVNLGPGALSFELRAWTDHAEDWMQIRSDLAVAVKSALAKENISVP
jgi:small-conductance mechanosensitive channel